jgi:hypothetical protein
MSHRHACRPNGCFPSGRRQEQTDRFRPPRRHLTLGGIAVLQNTSLDPPSHTGARGDPRPISGKAAETDFVHRAVGLPPVVPKGAEDADVVKRPGFPGLLSLWKSYGVTSGSFSPNTGNTLGRTTVAPLSSDRPQGQAYICIKSAPRFKASLCWARKASNKRC